MSVYACLGANSLGRSFECLGTARKHENVDAFARELLCTG
jgi:hypothetical protein